VVKAWAKKGKEEKENEMVIANGIIKTITK
jgi:hypothetical protein